MLDDLFEDINPVAFIITYVIALFLLNFLRKQWIGTSMEMSWIAFIFFAIIILPINYVILRYWANKD
jgi:hypothetical protein